MVRHGQSEWQVHRDPTVKNAPLTVLGEQQAHQLGPYLAEAYAIDAIFASPLRRSHKTAMIAASYLGLPVTLDEDLREFDDWEAGWAPLPVSRWDMSPPTPHLNPGYEHFRAQVLAAMQRCVEPYLGDKTVLVVAHGGTIGVMLRILMGADTPRTWIWNAAINMVEWDRPEREGSWIFHYMNQMDHLPTAMRTH